MIATRYSFSFFFFNDTATTEIYTLSLHDALPISGDADPLAHAPRELVRVLRLEAAEASEHDVLARAARARGTSCSLASDRKSTRLNSSHSQISYAVFCLKKKKALSCLLLPVL